MLYGDDLAYIHAAGFGGLVEGAAPEIIRRLQSAPAEVRRVLDVGCDAGPLTAALSAQGFEVTGLDVSADLLAMARHAIPDATFIHGSVYGGPLPECDALVAAGEPLTYHSETAPAGALLRGFFQSAAETLPQGGLLIFDVIETGEPPLNRPAANPGSFLPAPLGRSAVFWTAARRIADNCTGRSLSNRPAEGPPSCKLPE